MSSRRKRRSECNRKNKEENEEEHNTQRKHDDFSVAWTCVQISQSILNSLDCVNGQIEVEMMVCGGLTRAT